MTTLAKEDLPRLTKQLDRVRATVLGSGWWTLSQISEHLYLQHGSHFPEASVSARLRDLRRQGFIVDRRRKSKGLWEYRVSRRQQEIFCDKLTAEREFMELTK